jgi:hypothetical protein
MELHSLNEYIDTNIYLFSCWKVADQMFSIFFLMIFFSQHIDTKHK